MNKVPKAWLTAGTKPDNDNKKQVTARIDMSAEVAGAGLCPDCRKPMERVMVNDQEMLVCDKDRIALPIKDEVDVPAAGPVQDVGVDSPPSLTADFGPSTAKQPV